MKRWIAIGGLAAAAILSFLFFRNRTAAKSNSQAQSFRAISNGGFTWYVGDMTVKGANVSDKNVIISPVQNGGIAPGTNGASK